MQKWSLFILAGVLSLPSSVIAQELADETGAPEMTTLKEVMPKLGEATGRIQSALWRDDFAAVADAAREIVAHPGLSKEEQERIMARLGKDTSWFSQADQQVHKAAAGIAEAADRKDAKKVVKALGQMQEGCVACHSGYRARLRK